MPSLSAPQHIFLNGLNTKFRAFVGGFGSGKTFVGCTDLCIFAGKHPKTTQGYFATTYPAIRDIFYPTMEEAAYLQGYTAKVSVSNKEVDLYRGRRWYGKIICRSMDNPGSIIGFKIARALVDEIDTLPKVKAQEAWNKIIARLRLVIDGVENGIGVTTTPEGFMFVYETFANDPKASYSMVQASSYENEAYLPPDYIPSLIETYPKELAEAYIMGNFVNLRSGTVYNVYNRKKHDSKETIQEKEPLFIGMDFNVTNMSAAVHVKRDGAFHRVAELHGIYDTPAMIDTILQKYPEHHIYVYPDASGGSRKTVNASISDIALLQAAGFTTRAKKTNPMVKDRVLSKNKALEDGKYFVNADACPESARCLEQQCYDDNGEPDKKNGHDHMNDAGGYLTAYEFPVRKPVIEIPVRFAV